MYESWRSFKGENWRSFFPSPSNNYAASPNYSNYSFTPYEHRQSAFHPQHSYNPYNHQRELSYPASRYGPNRGAPYTMPFQYQQRRQEEAYFITPNAGMAENQKFCKSDEHPNNRRRLEDFEDFASQDETIATNVKTQSTVCTINWSLSSKFSSVRYHVICELFQKDEFCEKLKKDVRAASCQFQTAPGGEYEVAVRLVNNVDGGVRLSSPKKPFKAIFSMSEINELYSLATNFAGKNANQRFIYLYRVKPTVYFDDIELRTNNIMEKYIKDANGHAASPINGEIRGLFFSGQLFNGTFPPKSPFGDKLFYINPNRLFTPESVNIYFADFYCTGRPHYVTITICLKGSSTDSYCKRHIKQLNIYDNPFLRVEAVSKDGQRDYNYYVNDSVHVEICYTEDVHLSWGYFEQVEPVGIGSSRVGGLRNKLSCTVCNFSKENNILLASVSEKVQELSNSAKSKASTPQQQKSGENSNKRKLSEQSGEPAEKQPRVEVQKKTMLIELLEKDRAQRKYPDLSEEVASLVSDLVETVGTEIDLENFRRKIQEGISDEQLLNQNFLELETKN